MDEAFLPLHAIVNNLGPETPEFVDETEAFRMYVDKFEIDMPVELSITTDDNGQVTIGTAPPLYYVDTTYRPAYHQIRFTAVRNDEAYGE